MLDPANFVLIIFTQGVSSYDVAYKALEEISTLFNRTSSATLTIGLSGIFRDIKMLGKAFYQAKHALRYKSVVGNNRIIDYIKINATFSGDSVLSREQVQNIISHVRNHEYSKAKKIIEEYFDSLYTMSDISIDALKNSICELSIIIPNIVTENTGSMQTVFGREVKPISELSSIELLSEIRLWTLSLFESLEVFDLLQENSDIKSEVVKRAISYIISHYDKPLTIELVAKQLFVSERHLMRCFKTETGVTFNEYLTKYRMSKAIHLLRHSEYKIYEIAHLVGYNDSRYFCKLFKKIIGKEHTFYRSKRKSDRDSDL